MGRDVRRRAGAFRGRPLRGRPSARAAAPRDRVLAARDEGPPTASARCGSAPSAAASGRLKNGRWSLLDPRLAAQQARLRHLRDEGGGRLQRPLVRHRERAGARGAWQVHLLPAGRRICRARSSPRSSRRRAPTARARSGPATSRGVARLEGGRWSVARQGVGTGQRQRLVAGGGDGRRTARGGCGRGPSPARRGCASTSRPRAGRRSRPPPRPRSRATPSRAWPRTTSGASTSSRPAASCVSRRARPTADDPARLRRRALHHRGRPAEQRLPAARPLRGRSRAGVDGDGARPGDVRPQPGTPRPLAQAARDRLRRAHRRKPHAARRRVARASGAEPHVHRRRCWPTAASRGSAIATSSPDSTPLPSDWAVSGSKEYTNLGAGDYVFRVWGRDARGNLSGPVELAVPACVRRPG